MGDFLKSREVHAALRRALAPWFKAAGFRRLSSSIAGWYYQAGPHRFIMVWCEITRWGEAETGSAFCVNLQIASQPKPGAILTGHGYVGAHYQRLGALLNAADAERIRELNNQTRARLDKPGPDHWMHQQAESQFNTYKFWLSQFELISEPYRPGQDIWFQYRDSEDLARQVDFVQSVLPRSLRQFVATHVEHGILNAIALRALAPKPWHT